MGEDNKYYSYPLKFDLKSKRHMRALKVIELYREEFGGSFKDAIINIICSKENVNFMQKVEYMEPKELQSWNMREKHAKEEKVMLPKESKVQREKSTISKVEIENKNEQVEIEVSEKPGNGEVDDIALAQLMDEIYTED